MDLNTSGKTFWVKVSSAPPSAPMNAPCSHTQRNTTTEALILAMIVLRKARNDRRASSRHTRAHALQNPRLHRRLQLRALPSLELRQTGPEPPSLDVPSTEIAERLSPAARLRHLQRFSLSSRRFGRSEQPANASVGLIFPRVVVTFFTRDLQPEICRSAQSLCNAEAIVDARSKQLLRVGGVIGPNGLLA